MRATATHINDTGSIFLILLVSFFLGACTKTENLQRDTRPWFLRYPAHFPSPSFPPDNEPNEVRIELGKALFYDPVLSIDSSISCASCHKQEHAFADIQANTPGVFDRPGTRNVPGIFNLAYQSAFLREASLPSLEMQVLVPIQEHNEFNSNIVDIAEKLKNIPWYDSMSKLAYNREPDAFTITRSIAAFERTIVSAGSKYDQVKLGRKHFTNSEKLGYALFTQKLNCARCHPEPFFTNDKAMNNGLYPSYDDPGRWRVTKNPGDSGSFKVPSLRNVALTPPYMHDGSLPSLQEVINHYQSGGKKGPYQHPWIQAFQLSPEEKLALIDFLKTLSDEAFIQDPNYR
ncbi:MAG: c-type cytochrome [Bacteroidota bacterium]|nr:c-type cytochrome [Bacteroidota bacterium]MDX5430638.1 c-type cytochrome [Bacteroidota bacterium]MDX5469388.1 c-type cytochrome [Bacteroidota bacterium]